MDRRLDELLYALMQNMMIAVSGEKLARDLGVSHSTLVRWIDKLREAGIEIRGELFTGYRLRVTLFELPGSRAAPVVSSVGAVASDMPNANPYVPSPLGGAEGIELAVPRFSQEIHTGEYPQFDGGGEAWCSPTSTSMILAYWNRGPSPADYAYVQSDYPNVVDPWVDFAARATFDYHYQGAGNWPFNTAYAATHAMEGYVARFTSMAQIEDWIAAGVPVVVSYACKNDLTGAPIPSSNGHLAVVVGFDAAGNPVVNDPAAPDDSQVQRTYLRSEFESLWLEHSGGTVYLIYPPGQAVPSL